MRHILKIITIGWVGAEDEVVVESNPLFWEWALPNTKHEVNLIISLNIGES
jgi:hypothetical protein